MSTQGTSHFLLCPECGARSLAGETTCWLCRQPLPAVPVSTDTGSPARPNVADRGSGGVGSSFAVAALSGAALGVVALLVLCLGVGLEAPGLGIVLAVILVPIFIRVYVLARRSRGPGQPPTGTEMTSGSLATCGIVVVFIVAAMVTFFFSCLAVVMASLSKMH